MSSLLLTPILTYSFSYVSCITYAFCLLCCVIVPNTIPTLNNLTPLSSLTNEHTNPISYYTYSRHILPNSIPTLNNLHFYSAYASILLTLLFCRCFYSAYVYILLPFSCLRFYSAYAFILLTLLFCCSADAFVLLKLFFS